MKLAGLGLTVALVLSVSHRAEADCGRETWVGTPTGASIPAKGSLYVFDGWLDFRAPKSRVGGPIVAETRVGENVLRLDYVTKADELELAGRDNPSLFQVNRGWKAPAASPRVIQYWHHVSSWECSSSDSVMLQIDQPTAAFRVFWQFEDHPTRQLVLPARTAANNVSVLELGKINCVGAPFIDPAELASGGKLVVVAIRFDGSEVLVTGLPITISTAKMPTSEAGVSQAIGYPVGTEPTAPVQPIDHDWPFHMFMLLLVPAVVLTYVALRDRSVKAV
jgi:hypothetical protein